MLNFDEHHNSDEELGLTNVDAAMVNALNPLGSRNGININYDPQQFSVSAV